MYPLSAYSLPNALSVNAFITSTSRSSTQALVRLKFVISPFSLHSRCSLKSIYHPIVLFPIVAISLKTFMLKKRLLCMTGMHVLSTKLMPVHLPNNANFKNMVIATKQRDMTSIKRLYEKVCGNKPFHKVCTHER